MCEGVDVFSLAQDTIHCGNNEGEIIWVGAACHER